MLLVFSYGYSYVMWKSCWVIDSCKKPFLFLKLLDKFCKNSVKGNNMYFRKLKLYTTKKNPRKYRKGINYIKVYPFEATKTAVKIKKVVEKIKRLICWKKDHLKLILHCNVLISLDKQFRRPHYDNTELLYHLR